MVTACSFKSDSFILCLPTIRKIEMIVSKVNKAGLQQQLLCGLKVIQRREPNGCGLSERGWIAAHHRAAAFSIDKVCPAHKGHTIAQRLLLVNPRTFSSLTNIL